MRSEGASKGRFRLFADVILTIAILGLLILVAARFERVATRHETGVAVATDGDSLTIDGRRVRLRGIDAPEYGQICQKAGSDYRCGRNARSALADLIGSRPVVCEGWERDRYGRFLADCVAGATNLNRAQVEAGWAVAYGDFEAEERRAREGRIGLWAGEFDQPRVWRQTHGGMAEVDHDLVGALMNWLREIFRFG